LRRSRPSSARRRSPTFIRASALRLETSGGDARSKQKRRRRQVCARAGSFSARGLAMEL